MAQTLSAPAPLIKIKIRNRAPDTPTNTCAIHQDSPRAPGRRPSETCATCWTPVVLNRRQITQKQGLAATTQPPILGVFCGCVRNRRRRVHIPRSTPLYNYYYVWDVHHKSTRTREKKTPKAAHCTHLKRKQLHPSRQSLSTTVPRQQQLRAIYKHRAVNRVQPFLRSRPGLSNARTRWNSERARDFTTSCCCR